MVSRVRPDRHGQVLVYPGVRPGSFLAAALVIAALAAGSFAVTQHAQQRRQARALHPTSPGARVLTAELYRPLQPAAGSLFGGGVLRAPLAGVVDATVLAHTLNLGADGPRVPIAMGFARDGAAVPAAALGRGVVVGETRSAVVPRGAVVSVVTAARYDAYGAVEDSIYVRSDLPGMFVDAPQKRAVMLVNGDRLPHAQRLGYGGQPSLAEILGPRVDHAGRVVLPPNQAVLAYEYTSHFHHPAADFQDLVVLLTYTAAR